MRRLLPSVLLATLVLPAAPAAAGSWGADRAQTRSGVVNDVHAAGGSGDRLALGWARTLGRTQRAEVRLGRARTGLAGAAIVVDTQAGHSVESPLPAYAGNGAFDLVWRRFRGDTHRIRHRVVDRDRRLGATFELTTTGESAYDPMWVEGASRSLVWSRRTRADGVDFAATGPRGVRLPSAPLSHPGADTDATGLATLAWVNDGRVLISDRGPDAGPFGAPVVLATDPDANRAAVLRGPGGSTLVFWRSGVDLVVAVRAPGAAAFGARRTVLAGTTDAPQLALTGTGEVLVVAPVGDSSLVGAETLVRLGADGAPLGPPLVLGRGRAAQLAADGTGSAFVAWMSEGAERAVTARRIAPGGILGAPRLLAARSDQRSRPALAATREGGAVAAWIAGGDVHARTYRP